jgi:hypothetical protein
LFHPREACKGFREFVADLERMPIRPANGVLGWIFVVVAVATLVAVVVSFARG